MNSYNTKIHAFRLKPGQDLKKEIEQFVINKKIEAGYIITCVGSLNTTHIRYANQQEGVMKEGHFEIVSLVGTLSMHGCHLHLCAADSVGQTFGGHLLDGNTIYTTAEIVVGESDNLIFTREKDGSTPWDELQIKQK